MSKPFEIKNGAKISLTTSQVANLIATWGVEESGSLIYDTDKKQLFTWNGLELNPVKNQILYMTLNSSQNINVISPFVDLDFIQTTNTIDGASVSSNFVVSGQEYKGVVTLPKGKYKTSFKINVQNETQSQKIPVINISRYFPSVIYYPDSTVYGLVRSNGGFGTIQCVDANYSFLELTQEESFGIIGARAGANGGLVTVPEQSFWKIEKID